VFPALGLALLLAASGGDARILPSASNRTQADCMEVQPFTPFAFYLLVEPGTSDLAGWQATLEIPPGLTVMDWTVLPPTALDHDPADLGFRVDLADPVPPGAGPVAVARIWAGVFTLEIGPGEVGLASDPTWRDATGQEHGFVPRNDGTGWPSATLRLRCGVAGSGPSWGAIKARFGAPGDRR